MKSQALPFTVSDADLVAAARAVASIDDEIQAVDSELDDLKTKVDERKAKKKLLEKDRTRALSDLSNASKGRRPVFPTEDRRAEEPPPAKGKGKGEAAKPKPPVEELGPEPTVFHDAGFEIHVSDNGKGKFVVDKYSRTIALADTGAGQWVVEGKCAKHFSTTDEARVGAIEAAIEKVAKRYKDDHAIAEVYKLLQDTRRTFPGYENAADV